MTDIVRQASAIAELHDLDLFQPFFDDLTTWRPEHEGLCEHCQASLAAHLERLILQHQLHPTFVVRMLRRVFAETENS